jgi:3-deoxy-D-manno-octulosonic-acid transferase
VQEPEDVDRWHRLGVERSRIKYTGSIKYDPADFDYTAEAQGSSGVVGTSPGYVSPVISLERPVLFGGSTHRGEEEILTRAFLSLREKFPSLCLFIAPRHVERVQQIRAQLEALSLDVRVASRVAGDNETKADCVLLDRTGELQRWYSIATVVFIGKSLTAHGGQNPVEPIRAGKPVIFGPHMENFATLARTLVSKNGAIQVSDIDSLERGVDNLLRDSETRQRLVQSAREVLNQHRGATARAAALIADLRSRREAEKE